MTTPMALGRLEKVDPRLAWKSEPQDFTPWLAREENLSLLGETIGLELELEATEKSVGPFSADILCKEKAEDRWVLIENQLERTDHTHLGQIITYAAGLNAVIVVWISTLITEQHRAALDWLNQISEENVNFFGLEIELWRIGDSPVAPKFNVVSKPNDWSKAVIPASASVELTEAKQLQLEFWMAFHDFAKERGTKVTPTRPLPQHWMNLAIGRSGFGLTAIASLWDSETESYDSNEVRAEVSVTVNDAKKYFGLLTSEASTIESELGYPLTWHDPPNANACRVYVRRPANLRDATTWPELHQWLLERLEELKEVFGPRIRDLALPPEEADSAPVEE